MSTDGVRAPVRTSAGLTASNTTARPGGGAVGPGGVSAAGPAGPGPPSGPGGATTPGRPTGGLRAGGTVNSSGSVTSSGQSTVLTAHRATLAKCKLSLSLSNFPLLLPSASVKLYHRDAGGERVSVI